MGKGAAVNEETPYEAAEKRLGVPPVRERGRRNENPPESSFWQLIRQGLETHDRDLFEATAMGNPAHRGVFALLAKTNQKLESLVADLNDTHVLDVADLLAEVGRARADPGEYWHLGRVPFSNELNQVLARRVLALRGHTTRVLVLDLDNALRGGVLGGDGHEGLKLGGAYPGSAFQEFQRPLRALARRGIALAVASENDEDLAIEWTSEHSEMIPRPEDIVAHRIGWNETAPGIDDMLEELNLGKASCVFIDDNPVEREEVRRHLPEVAMPDMATLSAEIVETPRNRSARDDVYTRHGFDAVGGGQFELPLGRAVRDPEYFTVDA